MKTGFNNLDKVISLNKGELICVAARPGMGKSTFAINIATNVAILERKGVAIFNLELSKEEVERRILCSEYMIDRNQINSGKLKEDDLKKLKHYQEKISKAPIYIDDTAGISVTEIYAKCRKLKQEKDIELVVVDYLQLIQASEKNANREQEISEISKSLKILAKELDVTVIVLSQVSRSVEKRENKRPMISDFRESETIAITQCADTVIFLYRDDYYDKDSLKKGILEVIIAKNRHGLTGTVELGRISMWCKLVNLDKHYSSCFANK